ncbi:hypothetical protein [Sporichthya polymorpha]|uniref:hypothetical protein n=1 Tax=Sporichthya polymorpha TaxID=35751 RepID=UPI0012ECB210|nr:hypothetical protein [Sporichthya polymorpha]
MPRRRSRYLVPLALAAAVLGPTAAYGFWTVTSSDVNGSARADVIGSPSVQASLSGGEVRIAVTAPGSGPVPTSYRVDRTSPSAKSGVCTITADSAGVGTCLDNDPSVLATNTYRVFAVAGPWTALPANAPTTSIFVPVVDRALTVAVSPATAGSSTTLELTATTAGLRDLLYNGTRNLLITGAADSPNGTAPTYPVTATFSAGRATVSVVLTNAAPTVLTVVSEGRSGSSSSFPVAPASAATYALTGPATAQAGVTYTLAKVTATDAYGNLATGHTGSRVLTWSGAGTAANGATPTASTTATFTGGVATNVALTLVKAETAMLRATTGGITTPSALRITVGGGLPTSAAWAGISSVVPGTGLVNCAGQNCSAFQLGNEGGIEGTIALTDAYGNPAANPGTGWSLTFVAVKTKGQGTGDFTVEGRAGNPLTHTIPATGASSVTFRYMHPGNADWKDDVTITLSRPNGTVAATLTAALYKTQ